MTSGAVTIDVQDLRRFALDMRKLSPEISKELTVAVRGIVKPVAAEIKSSIREKRQRHVKGTRSANSAVMYGVNANGSGWVGYNRNNPYVGWLDFGGTLHATAPKSGHKRGRPNTQDRMPYKHSRYMYPAIMKRLPETRALIVVAFQQLFDKYGNGKA